jgi:hypothetical protein
LQEACRLMLGEAMDAATASHHVGYESPLRSSAENTAGCLERRRRATSPD